MLIYPYFYSCFPAAMAELTSCGKAHKVWNINYLVLCGKFADLYSREAPFSEKLVLLSEGCHSKIPTSKVTSKKFVLSQCRGYMSKIKCQQYWFLLRAMRESLFHTPLLPSGLGQQALACKCITPISAPIFTWPSPLCLWLHMAIFPLCMCLCLFHCSDKDTKSYCIRAPHYSHMTSS